MSILLLGVAVRPELCVYSIMTSLRDHCVKKGGGTLDLNVTILRRNSAGFPLYFPSSTEGCPNASLPFSLSLSLFLSSSLRFTCSIEAAFFDIWWKFSPPLWRRVWVLPTTRELFSFFVLFFLFFSFFLFLFCSFFSSFTHKNYTLKFAGSVLRDPCCCILDERQTDNQCLLQILKFVVKN